MAGIMWLAFIACSCVVMLPLALVGSGWARRFGDRSLSRQGIIAALLCLPGFCVGIVALPYLFAG